MFICVLLEREWRGEWAWCCFGPYLLPSGYVGRCEARGAGFFQRPRIGFSPFYDTAGFVAVLLILSGFFFSPFSFVHVRAA